MLFDNLIRRVVGRTTSDVEAAARKPQPNTDVFTEPSARSLIEWTPAMLRTALASADGGHLRYAADLCEALMGDGRVQAALTQRVRGLLGLPLEFETDSDRIKEAIGEDFYKAYPEEELAQFKSWAIMLGVALAQHQVVEVNGRWIPRLKTWNPRWLRFDWPTRTWRVQVDGGAEVEVKPGDGRWVLYTPGGDNRPWMNGAWRATARAWLLKSYGISDWGRYSEAHGSPLRVGTAPEGTKKEDRKEFARDLGDVGAQSGMALPAGFDVKLVEATARTWETFREAISWACSEVAIAIVGQNLTSEVKGGAFAAADVHNQVRHDIIEGDAESDSTTLREQSLTWWAAWNFGDPELAPFPRRKTEPPEDKKAIAESHKAAGEAITALKGAGLQVDEKAYAERYGVPLKEEQDEQPDVGQLYEYHFQYGVITVNEARARLGLPAIKGGDVPAKPLDISPGDQQALRAGGCVHLTGGAGAELPRGAAEGQAYADELAAKAEAEAAKRLDVDLAELVRAVDETASVEQLRERLASLYGSMNANALAELTEKAILLGELAGRYSALKDL